MLTGMLPIIIVFAVMIFFMMRSQKKQQQKRQEMLDKIVKGSRVLLNSGMLGNVVEVREKTFRQGPGRSRQERRRRCC